MLGRLPDESIVTTIDLQATAPNGRLFAFD